MTSWNGFSSCCRFSMLTRCSFWTGSAVALAGLLVATPASAQLPSPQITVVSPAGCKQGGETKLKVTGLNLEEPTAVVFSHPGITAQYDPGQEDPKDKPKEKDKEKEPKGRGKKPANTTSADFNVRVAKEVPPGVYEARFAGRFGVSNPRAFMVGTRDEIVETGSHATRETALPLAINTTLNADTTADQIDYFKLSLKKGEGIVIDCAGQRIDSRMDATLVLEDSAGVIVAKARNSARRDPVLSFVPEKDGDYILSVYDQIYSGGPDFGYRLTVHSGPHIDFIFPPVGTPGQQGKFTLYGRNLPGGKPVANMPIDGGKLEQLEVSIQLPGEMGQQSMTGGAQLDPVEAFADGYVYRLDTPQGQSNPVVIGYATAPVVPEAAENNDPAKAQAVNLPTEVAGQFFPQGDIDWFSFQGKKGETIIVEVIAHRLGINCDPHLVIQKVTKNDKGEDVVTQVADVDDLPTRRRGGDNKPVAFDPSSRDPLFQFKPDADATYRVMIHDLLGDSVSNPRLTYRLSIRGPQPDFRAAVYADLCATGQNDQMAMSTPVVRRGGSLALAVSIDRRDAFDGTVEVSVEGLPPSIKCPPAVLSGDADLCGLVLSAEENSPAWTGAVKVIAKATIDGKQVVRQARPVTILYAPSNQQPVQSRLSQDLMIAVTDKDNSPAMIVAGEGKPLVAKLGGTVSVPVKVTRRDGFSDAIKFTVIGLPGDMKADGGSVTGAEGKVDINLASNKKVMPGTYTVYLKGTAKYKIKGTDGKDKDITIEVVSTPVVLQIEDKPKEEKKKG